MSPDRLFTPRFFVMCGFSFTVFLSAFQLLPTAPFHILDARRQHVGVGALPRLPHLRVGVLGAAHRRARRSRSARAASSSSSSVAIAVFSIAYAVIPSYRVMLGARPRPRRVLVGPAVRVGRLHDEHAAREPPGGGHRLLGAVDDRGDRRRAVVGFWIFTRRLARALPRRRGAQPDHGGDRVESAGGRRQRTTLPKTHGRRARVARARDLGHPVSLLVRLRRHHELHGALRRRQRRHAEGHLPDDAGDRDPADAAAGRTAGRSLRLPARVPAVPRADLRSASRACRSAARGSG